MIDLPGASTPIRITIEYHPVSGRIGVSPSTPIDPVVLIGIIELAKAAMTGGARQVGAPAAES